MTGPFNGLQAEYARIPYANVGLVKLPEEVSDEQAILISDIFPTGYFGADLAEIVDGNVVAVLGCGPVGQFVIASARLLGASRILAVDSEPSRLDMARQQGAEVINFEEEEPVETIRSLTQGIGVDRIVDAVGVDALQPHRGPAEQKARQHEQEFRETRQKVAPETHPEGENWRPGDAPQQALMWAVEAVAKAGTVAVIGVYPAAMQTFPIGAAMNKNLTLQMGNCNHRRYIPELVNLVRTGMVNPIEVLTRQEPLTSAIEAYKAFDTRRPGWIKVELKSAEQPQASAAA